jgi:hypothetical protein
MQNTGGSDGSVLLVPVLTQSSEMKIMCKGANIFAFPNALD